jgi:hypothetical protein
MSDGCAVSVGLTGALLAVLAGTWELLAGNIGGGMFTLAFGLLILAVCLPTVVKTVKRRVNKLGKT